mmetsp:Transcript_106281/g.317600  ORF Transcript_106281/g.317600 Transcript_106281/m.317600 type:complete len:471 (-) Transcript_106281:754-2166(-)
MEGAHGMPLHDARMLVVRRGDVEHWRQHRFEGRCQPPTGPKRRGGRLIGLITHKDELPVQSVLPLVALGTPGDLGAPVGPGRLPIHRRLLSSVRADDILEHRQSVFVQVAREFVKVDLQLSVVCHLMTHVHLDVHLGIKLSSEGLKLSLRICDVRAAAPVVFADGPELRVRQRLATRPENPASEHDRSRRMGVGDVAVDVAHLHHVCRQGLRPRSRNHLAELLCAYPRLQLYPLGHVAALLLLSSPFGGTAGCLCRGGHLARPRRVWHGLPIDLHRRGFQLPLARGLIKTPHVWKGPELLGVGGGVGLEVQRHPGRIGADLKLASRLIGRADPCCAEGLQEHRGAILRDGREVSGHRGKGGGIRGVDDGQAHGDLAGDWGTVGIDEPVRRHRDAGAGSRVRHGASLLQGDGSGGRQRPEGHLQGGLLARDTLCWYRSRGKSLSGEAEGEPRVCGAVGAGAGSLGHVGFSV